MAEHYDIQAEIVSSEALVEHFGMMPHPEGGFYSETYRSHEHIAAEALPAFGGERAFSTAILFLLRQGDYSHLHRIRQDELWHFYLGGPLRLVLLSPEGQASEVMLGSEVLSGQQVQFAVPAGYWFGATPAQGTAFSLVGCTVAPGFDFADFTLARREELERLFPAHVALVREFC